MSLRLVSKEQGRKPIGVVRGKPVYGISGAIPDDNDNGGNNGGTDSGGTDGGGTGSGDGTDGSGTGDGDDDKGAKDGEDKDGVISKKEYDAAIARMKAADKNNADLQKKIKEYEDKDKSETERLTGQVTTLTEENTSLKEENSRLRFDNAFALQSKHSWQDPSIVLDLVRKAEGVSVEEDGTIKGLTEALDKIAKEKPFLLKDKDAADNGGGSGPTGTSTGSGKKNSGKGPDQETLRKKYPALNI